MEAKFYVLIGDLQVIEGLNYLRITMQRLGVSSVVVQ